MFKRALNCSFDTPLAPAFLCIGTRRYELRSNVLKDRGLYTWQDSTGERHELRFLMDEDEGRYWYYNDQFWLDDDRLTLKELRLALEDERAMLVAQKLSRKRRIERARTVVARESGAPGGRREHIPDSVKQFVFQRDDGRCVSCQSLNGLQFDHIIPVALGGSSEPSNLQILCATCNSKKGSGLTTN